MFGAGGLALNILVMAEVSYLESIFEWSDIEKAIYPDADSQADTMNFRYSENDTAMMIKEYAKYFVEFSRKLNSE